jgi:hypothetical protein
MSIMVEANEPDTINYQFYLDSNQTKCVVHETYIMASQTILPKIFNIARISKFDVYGNPSEELQKILASFNPQIYNLFAGFSR